MIVVIIILLIIIIGHGGEAAPAGRIPCCCRGGTIIAIIRLITIILMIMIMLISLMMIISVVVIMTIIGGQRGCSGRLPAGDAQGRGRRCQHRVLDRARDGESLVLRPQPAVHLPGPEDRGEGLLARAGRVHFLQEEEVTGLANCPSIVDVRPLSVLRFWISEGFYSSGILILMGGTLMSIGSFPEVLSQ